jgi:hypothetical protein
VTGKKITCHVITCNKAEQSTMVWNLLKIEHNGKNKRKKIVLTLSWKIEIIRNIDVHCSGLCRKACANLMLSKVPEKLPFTIV